MLNLFKPSLREAPALYESAKSNLKGLLGNIAIAGCGAVVTGFQAYADIVDPHAAASQASPIVLTGGIIGLGYGTYQAVENFIELRQISRELDQLADVQAVQNELGMKVKY